MDLVERRKCIITDEKSEDFGRQAEETLRKVAVISVVHNPFAGRYVEDLNPMIEASRSLGATMAKRAMEAMGSLEVQSYGKGGLVGTAGEQEHANALLTTTFAEPFREVIGGGDAWISSMTKVVAPGTLIDIPMNHKHAVYVRSHYDGMSLVLPDAPLPDEIAVIFCFASRGRLNARVGGMTHEQAMSGRE